VRAWIVWAGMISIFAGSPSFGGRPDPHANESLRPVSDAKAIPACEAKLKEVAKLEIWKRFNIPLRNSLTEVYIHRFETEGRAFRFVALVKDPRVSNSLIEVTIPLKKSRDGRFQCELDSGHPISAEYRKDAAEHLRKEAGEKGNFTLLSIPHREMDKNLPFGSDETHTPKNLQGMFWMDGNPLPDKLVSLAKVRFTDLRDQNGKITGHRAYIPVYDQGVWTWDDTRTGNALYKLVHDVKLTYKVDFNADYTFGQVTPLVTLIPGLKRTAIPPSMLVDFTLTLNGPDEFSRDSILAGKKHNYRFRRVVDGTGKRLPAWDDFVRKMEEKNLPNGLIPVCNLDNGAGPIAGCGN
jgi:hypothetical protein